LKEEGVNIEKASFGKKRGERKGGSCQKAMLRLRDASYHRSRRGRKTSRKGTRRYEKNGESPQ